MARTRRSERIQTAKGALQSNNAGVVGTIDGGISADTGDPAAAAAPKQRNKKIIFDADYDAADDDAGSEEKVLQIIANSDDDVDDDDAPVEEVSGSSSRKLMMDQRTEERLASQSSTYSISSKRKRRKKKEDAHVDTDDDDDDEEEELLFRSIDEERRSQAKEAKKLRRGKPFENNTHKPSGRHISFSSDVGLLEEEMKSKKLAEHNLEIVVNKSLQKNQAHALMLGNKKPSAAALLFAQRSGTIVDEEEPQWARTKSRKYYKVIGKAGW